MDTENHIVQLHKVADRDDGEVMFDIDFKENDEHIQAKEPTKEDAIKAAKETMQEY